MAKDDKSLPIELPRIDDVVLVEMSGYYGLSQDELWQVIGDVPMATLAARVLSEGVRLERQGASPRDAFNAGVGWLLLAMKRQIDRDHNKERVAALWATLSDIDEAAVASSDTA